MPPASARPAGPWEATDGASALEAFSWYFFRISGGLLVFLALGHLAIVHLLNSVDVIDYAWVAARWRSAGWRLYDGALLVLALLHGMNGARIVVEDYVHGRRWRLAARWILGATTIAFLVLGLATLIVAEPPP